MSEANTTMNDEMQSNTSGNMQTQDADATTTAQVEPSDNDQVVVEEPKIDYTMNGEEEKVLQLVAGYKTKWTENKGEEPSFATTYNDVVVGRANLRTLCWAFLAAFDELRENYENDESRLPIVTTVVRSGYVQAAIKITKMDHHSILDQHNRFESQAFNPQTDVGRAEYGTPLSNSSVWTLMKAMSAQLRAGVNRCFPRNLSDRSIADFPSTKSNTKVVKTKNGSVVKPNDDSKHKNNMVPRKPKNDTICRYPEEASWNGLTTSELVTFVYEIKDSYNKVFSFRPDLSRAYRDASRLRFEANEAARIKRQAEKQAEYEKRRAERQAEYERRQAERQTQRQSDQQYNGTPSRGVRSNDNQRNQRNQRNQNYKRNDNNTVVRNSERNYNQERTANPRVQIQQAPRKF
jgi:hypothetical protein